MIRFFKIIVSSYFWSQATYHAANEHYLLSLSYLDKSDNLREKDCEILLLRGFLCFALQQDEKSIEALSEAVEMIEISQKYNVDTKNYLINYATKIIVSLDSHYELKPQMLKQINFINVPQYLQNRYPNN